MQIFVLITTPSVQPDAQLTQVFFAEGEGEDAFEDAAQENKKKFGDQSVQAQSFDLDLTEWTEGKLREWALLQPGAMEEFASKLVALTRTELKTG